MSSTVYALRRDSLRALASDLSAATEAATVAVVRLDERLQRLGARAREQQTREQAGDAVLAEGALARAHVAEAQALIGLMGGVAPLEDLVLHDAGMDARLPTTEIVRAAGILQLRRSLARRRPDAVLARGAVRALAGLSGGSEFDENGDAAGQGGADAPGAGTIARRSNAPWEMPLPGGGDDDIDEGFDGGGAAEEEAGDEDERPAVRDPWRPRTGGTASSLDALLSDADAVLARSGRRLARFNDLSSEAGRAGLTVSDPAYDGEGRLDQWFDALGQSAALPAVLAAAAALDAWLLLQPSEHRGEAGFLLAATMLRQRGLAGHHLPALALGYRKGRFRWGPHQDEATRLAGLLAAITAGAEAMQSDLDRLGLAREVMLRRCEGKRGNARLPELVDLFVAAPLVTVQTAAKRLAVSPQAIKIMLKDLGASLPRELTGRVRYRAWGIV